ncbi:MAG: hypothetical protein AAGK21_15565 [Bacteroidota bacterium]
MGQQQLLLLIVGVIIVGLAVIVGIESFSENQRKFRQDQTIHLINDIVAKAQLWKMTPPPLGGGGVGGSDNFRTFTLDAVGLRATSTQGSREVIYRTEYTCLKIFPRTNRLQINALDTDCSNGSWWMRAQVRGTTPDEIVIELNNARAVSRNGQ